MSLLDLKHLEGLRIDGRAESLGSRRRRACDAVNAELGVLGPGTTEPAIAFRTYGVGELAVGIAGPVDLAMARRVGGLLRDLRPHSRQELVVTVALLGPWDPYLARVLGQARIHRLIDGGRLELCDADPALARALDVAPPPDLEAPGSSS